MTSWNDVVQAAAGGLLDESHWVDLKQELPPSNAKHNTNLAKDLASLAVHGGTLIIGVTDRDSRAGDVVGVELGKLADRVDQVARDKVRPPLDVRCTEIPDPDRLGYGCLLVHVPPSPRAPHMVDHVYYGRGDRANTKLPDEQVREIIRERTRHQSDVEEEVCGLAKRYLANAVGDRNGHLHVLVQPLYAPQEALADFLDAANTGAELMQLSRMVQHAIGPTRFSPDADTLTRTARRAEGIALTSLPYEGDKAREERLLDLVVREDGSVALLCGCGTTETDPGEHSLVFPEVIGGLVHLAVNMAGRLADEHSLYQGRWRAGTYLTRLAGARPWERQNMWSSGVPYTSDSYLQSTTATTEEMVADPWAVTSRLTHRLLRGLNVLDQHRDKPPFARPQAT